MEIEFESLPVTGHFERIDSQTLKWVPDSPVPFTVEKAEVRIESPVKQ